MMVVMGTPLGGEAMKLKEMCLGEFLALSRRKLARGKTKFTLYLNPTTLPPSQLKAYKEVAIEDPVVGVKYLIYTKPNPQDGGWLLHVKVEEVAPFNSIVLPQKLPEKQ